MKLCNSIGNSIASIAALLVATSLSAAPMHTTVGAYFTRLGDLNPPNNSFSADLWVWTLSDPASPLRPIETLRLRGARQVSAEKPENVVRGNRMYGFRFFTVTMQQPWDMRDFPFDEHTLVVPISEQFFEASDIVYDVDRAGSGIDPRIRLGDWEITGFTMTPEIVPYPSHFGDPLVKEPLTRWAEAEAHIKIRRKGVGTFFKVTLVGYIAFALTMLSFAFEGTLFGSRISLLVGALFADVVNMRSTESILGRSDDFTLIDKIHLAVAACIVVGVAMAFRSRRDETRRGDKLAATIVFVAFAALNVVLIW
ncbi:MAG TPA: hypothetical protein VMU84_11840 [Thermoanaerobaculia bacterium]|nr:hypothetical protein [Thermoanaerobaculia bacterium]